MPIGHGGGQSEGERCNTTSGRTRTVLASICRLCCTFVEPIMLSPSCDDAGVTDFGPTWLCRFLKDKSAVVVACLFRLVSPVSFAFREEAVAKLWFVSLVVERTESGSNNGRGGALPWRSFHPNGNSILRDCVPPAPLIFTEDVTDDADVADGAGLLFESWLVERTESGSNNG